MRRLRFGFLILAAAVGLATAAAAQDKDSSETTPSLEYKPPRPVITEPKAPHPLPPVTVFREVIGSFGMLEGSFSGPVDVARDVNGNLYVLDAGNNRVQKFDRFSKLVISWGSRGIRLGRVGKRDSEFNKPSAIAVGPVSATDATEVVYVVDAGNDRVQRFDLEGGFLNAWGSRGSNDGDFKSPQDVKVDKDGFVYVLDSGNDRVMKFNPGGGDRAIQKWEKSAFGVTGGNFNDLKSIALSDERFGYFYLLGAGCLVQQFKLDGTLVNSWPAIAPESGLCAPARIEVDTRNNYVYVLDSGNSLLMCYNPDGLYRWALRGADRSFSKPLGFAINPDGDEVLVADTDNNIVQKFTLR